MGVNFLTLFSCRHSTVFPKQHPKCFSEALENGKPLRWTSSLFWFHRRVRVKFECAFRHFHWIFFDCIENMFTKLSLFILFNQRTDSQYGKAIALLELAEQDSSFQALLSKYWPPSFLSSPVIVAKRFI